MNLKRRRQQFFDRVVPRFPVVVLPRRSGGSGSSGTGVPTCRDLLWITSSSADTNESFLRLFGQVAFWLALLLLLSGVSFSMLYARIGEYYSSYNTGVHSSRTKYHPRANVVAGNGDGLPHEFFRQHPPVSDWDAFAVAKTWAAAPSSSFSSSAATKNATDPSTPHLRQQGPSRDAANDNTEHSSNAFFRTADHLRNTFVERYGTIVPLLRHINNNRDSNMNNNIKGTEPDAQRLARGLLHRAFVVPETSPETSSRASFGTPIAASVLTSPPYSALLLQRWAQRLASVLDIGSNQDPEEQVDIPDSALRILSLGGSAAAGAGNYHGQAYSHELERLLEPLVDALRPPGRPKLQMYHAAFPDEEEWPLVWCFLAQLRDQATATLGEDDGSENNHQGSDAGRSISDTRLPHIILWDYADTSAPAKLEMFLRTVGTLWNTGNEYNEDHPLLVFRNLDAKGVSLLRHYGKLPVSLVLNETAAAQPMLDLDPAVRPPGFVHWDDWGDDGGGGGASQPRTDSASYRGWMTAQQHEWTAWLVVMHVLAALEYAVAVAANSSDPAFHLPPPPETQPQLPPPRYLPTNEQWSSLVLGDHAPKLQCFSSYVWRTLRAVGKELVPAEAHTPSVNMEKQVGDDESPQTSELLETALLTTGPGQVRNHLSRLIQQGAFHTPTEQMLLPHLAFYSTGWVLDLDTVSKRAKQRTAPHFRGFDDWKVAYQGTVASPPLILSVPTEVTGLWLCESSAPTPVSSLRADDSTVCSLARDVTVRLVGQPLPLVTFPVGVVTAFERSNPCVQVQLPDQPANDAADEVDTTIAANVDVDQRVRPPVKNADDARGDAPRLELSLQVTNPTVTYASGPCSLAHVLYVV